MAFRLKHWLGVVALASVLVAAWRLPLGSVRPGNAVPISEEEVRARELSSELRLARTTLDQVRRASRLAGRLLADRGERVTVHVPDDALVTPQDRARLTERVRSEVDARPRMRVAYAYDTGTAEESGLPARTRLETYLGEQGGEAYCMQVVTTRPGTLPRLVHETVDGGPRDLWSPWPSLLGPCAFYAEHGVAGSRIQAWLENGGARFAAGRRTAQTPRFPTPPRRSLLGINLLGGRGTTDVEVCLTGVAEACAEVFLSPDAHDRYAPVRPDAVVRSPALLSGTESAAPFPTQNWLLLDDLEREFGQEAFARFWTSGDDVRTAFEGAFGVDLGAWLVGWLDDGPGIERATPAPTRSATLEGLLTIVLMTGLASAWQRRRQVT